MRRLILCVAVAVATTSVAACSDSDPEEVMPLAAVRDACSALAADDSSAEGATLALKAVPFMELLAEHEAAELGATGSLPTRDERHDFIDRAITEVRDECPGPLLDDVEAFVHDVIDDVDGHPMTKARTDRTDAEFYADPANQVPRAQRNAARRYGARSPAASPPASSPASSSRSRPPRPPALTPSSCTSPPEPDTSRWS